MTSNQTYGVSEVLARVDEERTWWESVLEKGNEEAMLKPGLSADWSFRDVVDHLNFWSSRKIDKLYAFRNGTEYVDPIPAEIREISDEDEQTDRINEWRHESQKDTPLFEVLDLSRANLNRLYELVGTTLGEDLNNPDLFPYLEGNSLADEIMSGSYFEHTHGEHGPAMQAWIESQSPAHPVR